MNRKIRKVCEYRDYYCKSKKQVKNSMYETSYTDRKHLKKKNRFEERRCADKLYQRHFTRDITLTKL